MDYKEAMSREQVILMDLESMITEDSECRVIDLGNTAQRLRVRFRAYFLSD